MRGFLPIQKLMSLVFLSLYSTILAISIMPAYIGVNTVLQHYEEGNYWFISALLMSTSFGYLAHQITFPLLCGIAHRILPVKYPEGEFPIESFNGIKWATSTAIHRAARQHFPTYTLPSWYVNLYYILMGASISKGVQIATLSINDPQHVTIGAKSVIGGGSTINSHSVESGMIIIGKNVIGSSVTVGLNSILLAGACVQDNAIVGARSVVTKNMIIPSGEKWIGTPARRLNGH